MQTAIIEYTLKRDELKRHLELLHAVYADLETIDVDDFRFATFQLADDDASFVDVVIGNELPGPLPRLESFRRYRAGLDERCERRTFTELSAIGAFRFPA